MRAHPAAAPAGLSDEAVLTLMEDRVVRQMPIVDAAGRVVDIKLLDLLGRARPEPTTVLVMAGGLGTRLGEITRLLPKPLVRVAGRPVLETLVRELATQGFSHVLVAVRYKADLIQRFFGDGHRYGVGIEYLVEHEPLGTAGAIRLATARTSGPLVVTNADLLTRVDFRALLDFHRREANDLTIGVLESTFQLRYGVVETEGTRIVAIREKPSLRHMINAGMYVVEPTCASIVPEGRSDMDELISASISSGLRVGAFPIHEFWADIGDPDDLTRAEKEYSLASKA
jgi:NDP-sugar pyrophosphorylase family protein